MAKAIQMSEERSRALANMLADDIALAQGDAQSHIDRVKAYRLMLNDSQPRSNPPWPGASELIIPYVKQAEFALLSHFSPALLGVDPIWRVEANNRDSKRFADDVERFLQSQVVRHIKARMVMERAFDAALRDGTAIIEVGWRTQRERRTRWQQAQEATMDDAGQLIAQTGEITPASVEMVVYDAPTLDLVTVENFGTFPRANVDPQESPGVYRRVMLTGQEILERAVLGVFDAQAVDMLRALPGDHPLARPDDELRGIQAGMGAADMRFRAQSYELTLIYYRYAPREDSDEPAADWCFVLHEESKTILRAIPTPYWHGKRPYVVMSPYQDVEGFYGDSLAAAGAGDVQTAKTTLLRLAVDAMAIGIAPEMLVAQSLGSHVGDIKSRRGPGGILTMPDSFFENPGSKLQPFGNQGYSPSTVIPLLEALDREGQESTGVSDNIKGVQGNNVTATEASQIQDSAQKTIGFLSERFAEGMKGVGELIYDLNYQYQGNAGPSTLWQEINGAHETVMFEAFNGSYEISTNGVRDTSNRAVKAARSEKLLTTLMQFPQIVTNPSRLHRLVSDYVTDSGHRDPEAVIGSEDEWVQEAQAQAQQMQAQQAMMQGQPMVGEMPQGEMPMLPDEVMQ